VEFNIVATVGTSEVELKPYPGGATGEVPADKVRKVYAIILTNTATAANTLTINIYREGSAEASLSLIVPATSTLSITSNKLPLLVVPGKRTLKAVATSASITLVMACVDE